MVNFLGPAVLIAVVVVSNGLVPFGGINPLLPNRTFPLNVKFTFRTAEERIGPVCNRVFTVPASETTVDVGRSPEVPAANIRVLPQIQIEGTERVTGSFYTLLVATQFEQENQFATPTRPFIHYVVSDIKVDSLAQALTLSSYIPVQPIMVKSYITLVMLYRQPNPIPTGASVTSFIDLSCPLLGAGRCKFDVLKFARNYTLELEFAGYFMALTDKYSTAGAAALKIIPNGCFYLDKFDLEDHPFVGPKAHNLKLGVMAHFKSPPAVVGPLCGRVFSYKEDELNVTALTGRPVPARRLGNIPKVWYHTMDGDESWKEDWFTLVYTINPVDWPQGGTRQRPFIEWLVSNIHGGNINDADCVVPFFPPISLYTDQEVIMLLYKQNAKVEINPADFAEFECPYNFRCGFNVAKMAEEKNLTLVGAQNFQVAPDPHSVAVELKMGNINETTACHLLSRFPDEGRMVGQCLPKIAPWKELWEEMEKTKDPDEKKQLMEQMKRICPELAEDLSEDKMSEMKKMKEWMMKEMEDKLNEMKEKKGAEEEMKKKWFMHMLMKKMLEDQMSGWEKGDDNDSEEKKRDDNDSAEKRGDDNDSNEKRRDDNDSAEKRGDDNDSDEKRRDDNDSAEKRAGCGHELMEAVMKMRQGDDMRQGSWEEKEKGFGPCLKAVAERLKKLHQEYEAKKEKEDMKDKFEKFMKEKMSEFVKHMMMEKMSEHLGMSGCGGGSPGDKPCADPEKLRMYLWQKYVMMKEKKREMSSGEGSMEKWDEKHEKMEEMKKMMKEIMFFKSILSMMKDHKERCQEKQPDPMADFRKLLQDDPNWKRFNDDL